MNRDTYTDLQSVVRRVVRRRHAERQAIGPATARRPWPAG